MLLTKSRDAIVDDCRVCLRRGHWVLAMRGFRADFVTISGQ
jgi:hypothetical protein